MGTAKSGHGNDGARQGFSIPLYRPMLKGNELKYVTECVETGWVSSA